LLEGGEEMKKRKINQLELRLKELQASQPESKAAAPSPALPAQSRPQSQVEVGPNQ